MKNVYRRSALSYLLSWSLFSLILSQSGCSLFFGNIKPVEEKSNSYGILDLSLANSEWARVESSKEVPETPQSGIADIAFQSKKTASIISINSACKSYGYDRKESLSALTNELLLGISNVTLFQEKSVAVDKNPALQTTVQGDMNHEKMMLRTVVVQRGNCVYDLMFVSRPEKFQQNEGDFSSFVSSLRLK